MNGKICLITGATSGIGLAVTRSLARRNATVIIVGSNPRKCENVCVKIKSITGNSMLTYLTADLSSQEEIRRLAACFNRKYDHLDVLVNNAGAKFVSRQTTKDGLEMTFALNHLGYFLLTQLLLLRLKDGGDSRIINVSSRAHKGAIFDFNDLQNESDYLGKKAYSQSKLANI